MTSREPPQTNPRRRALMTIERPVALVGFMGAGKSSVGRRLSRALGLDFVDLDELVQQNSKKTISEIFREHGEVGFRARERSSLRDLLDEGKTLVIATGGGCFADPKMHEWLLSHCEVIYLEAAAETLTTRLLAGDEREDRPLLRGPDPSIAINRLLEKRKPAYQKAHHRIETDLKPVDRVVEELVRTMEVARLKPQQAKVDEDNQLVVESSFGPYSIELQVEGGAWLSDAILSLARSRRIAVISDSNVVELHADEIVDRLAQKGADVSLHTFEAGEPSKTLDTVAAIYDGLLESGFDRKSMLVALGGGVVGDICGFVASSILRGVDYIQVPTTTLACVDSSVGGKTGVNVSRGKNLVGAFWAPKAVLVSLAHLKTQSLQNHRAGLAEVVKIAATCDRGFFEWCEKEAEALAAMDSRVTLQAVRKAASLKAEVVKRDEREAGERAVLNFGHTVGHAFEAASNFSMLHGEAVALGMVAELEWAQAEGQSSRVRKSRLEALLLALDLPINWRDYPLDISSIEVDKKVVGTQLKLPVLQSIGQYTFLHSPISSVAQFVRG